MALPYYVEPDPSATGGEAYWLEGYAVGDAKLAAFAPTSASEADVSGFRVQSSGYLTEGASVVLGAPTRLLSTAAAISPVNYYVQAGYWDDGYALETRAEQSEVLIGSSKLFDLGMLLGSVSEVDLAPILLKTSGVLSESESETIIPGEKIAYSSGVSISESEMDAASVRVRTTFLISENEIATIFGANYIAASTVIPFPESESVLNATRIATAGSRFIGLSSALVAGRKKWEDEAESVDDWTEIFAATDTWTTISAPADAWTEVTY